MLTELKKIRSFWVDIDVEMSIQVWIEYSFDDLFSSLFAIDDYIMFNNTRDKCLEDITRIKIRT